MGISMAKSKWLYNSSQISSHNYPKFSMFIYANTHWDYEVDSVSKL